MPVARVVVAERIKAYLDNETRNEIGQSLAAAVAANMLDKDNPNLTAKDVTVEWVEGSSVNLNDPDLDITVFSSHSEERFTNCDLRRLAISGALSGAIPKNWGVSLWLVLRTGSWGTVEGSAPEATKTFTKEAVPPRLKLAISSTTQELREAHFKAREALMQAKGDTGSPAYRVRAGKVDGLRTALAILEACFLSEEATVAIDYVDHNLLPMVSIAEGY